jgi:type II secretory ATPase GspE/PulE/Tfp pilus assembly ATPase PilB-like protein
VCGLGRWVCGKETAITAIQAAMTGHQVYTSLHTNDAIGAIPRLMNIGVPNYLMSGAFICIMGQRLARRLCPHCKKEEAVTAIEKRLLGPINAKIDKIFKAQGCEKCFGGYKGRIVISEVLPFDRELDEMVAAGTTRKQVLEYAISKGFVTMVEDGLQKVVAGHTDLRELARVVDLTDRM